MTRPLTRFLLVLCSAPLVAACTGNIGDGLDDSNDGRGPGGASDSELGSGSGAGEGSDPTVPGAIDPSGGNGDSGTTTMNGTGTGTSTGTQDPGGSPDPDTPAQSGTDGVFEQANPWTKVVQGMAPSPSSKSIISWLDANGGWGFGELRIDFGMEVLSADASTPFVDFEPTDEFYSPDCDHVPMPMPAGGAIEAESGYSCDGDGDCHLIVVHEPSKTLYEMWRANWDGGKLYGGCAVTWDLTRAYGDSLRGEGCTSADGGGFPITPLLFTADEVAEGEINHAIRFILPNARIRKMTYVHPGTHSTFSTSGGPDAPPYGVRLRLRADFPMDSLPTEGARVVARGLQKFGMLLADGGNIALTGRSDRFSKNKWADVGVGPSSLSAIEVSDMEVVDMGAPIVWDGYCERND